MQTAQTIIKDYRRKRVIVCVTVALVTLVLTLGIRFISQRNINQDRIHDFTHHTVRALDKVLLSLEVQRETLLSLVGIPCSEANLILRKQAAILQTVRSIALIQDGILYCSSVFGSRNVPVSEFVPELPVSESRLLLSTDRWLVKGSPVLIQWSPVAGDGNDGVMEVVNIDLITKMILEPQRPQITDVVLRVGDNFLRDGQQVTTTPTFDEKRLPAGTVVTTLPFQRHGERPRAWRNGVKKSAHPAAAGVDAQLTDGLYRLARHGAANQFHLGNQHGNCGQGV
ncbi:Rtn protein [Enterobacter hormaechei]|nr:Rtn protein [Enterobacter hormaechei]